MSASSRPLATPLREGFTTGTAASAAASTALALLLGESPAACCSVPVPPNPGEAAHAGTFSVAASSATASGPRIAVPVAGWKRLDPNTATAWVIKDGGDDPDATHGATIHAQLALVPDQAIPYAGPLLTSQTSQMSLEHPLVVELCAGEGVGMVTLPGLPVPVGEPAINPAPRRQIYAALVELALRHEFHGRLRLTLSIPHGETMAKRTLNPRLGIVGGLSILGTHGTVRPYSHDAWAASIVEALHVAQATGCSEVMLSTGRRSEKLLQALYPHLPGTAFVQAADFAQFSLSHASALSFSRLTWGCFFGKLAKLAQGLPYTHAHEAPLDMVVLADWCQHNGLPEAEAALIAQCNTANQALDIILAQSQASNILHALTLRARQVAEGFAAIPDSALPIPAPHVRLHLFHLNGQELARA